MFQSVVISSTQVIQTGVPQYLQDFKNLSQWLKANKLSLNVKKTELIIFHAKNTKLDYGVKFKLNGRRLTPASTVKYLGILLDEHVLWTNQVNWVNSKLNQTIEILLKIEKPNASLPVLKIVYHSLFGSHLQYGSQLWGQGNCVNQNNIQNHQNQTLRKITFKKLHDPVNPLYKYLKVLKFKALLHLQNCLYCKLNKIRHLQNLL